VGNFSIGAAKASFGVRDYGGGDVDVMALDGRIRIDSAPATRSDSSRLAHSVFCFLPAGQIASVHLGIVSLHTVGRANIQSRLLWRDGMLEFVGEPLEHVAAEFNRYSRTKLVIDEETIRNFRVGGRFSAFDLDSLVATISRIFALRAQTRLTASGPVVALRLGRPIPNSTETRATIEQ
jgi:transmembrane sensor